MTFSWPFAIQMIKETKRLLCEQKKENSNIQKPIEESKRA